MGTSRKGILILGVKLNCGHLWATTKDCPQSVAIQEPNLTA